LISEQYRQGVTGPWPNLHKDYLYEDDLTWSNEAVAALLTLMDNAIYRALASINASRPNLTGLW
jgi:hypothetical protein